MNDTPLQNAGNAARQTPSSGKQDNGKSRWQSFTKEKSVFLILHIMVLLLSLYLVYSISKDTFRGVSFGDYSFQRTQFWICCFFLIDIIIEFILSKRKWHYVVTHFIFFLICIPYTALIYHFGWDISKEAAYLLRYIPLIRSAYILAIVVSWFSYSRATGLFFSYLIILLSTVYFASLTFYLFEFHHNPLVKNYTDALWWAAMDVTTVGSNIVAVTTVGRVLSVTLAALGMMMFPIFTVYITNIVTSHNRQGQSNSNIITIPMQKRTEEAEEAANQ